MTLENTSIQDINDIIIADFQSSLNQNIPLLPQSFNRVLAKTMSGIFILLYKYAGFMHRQQYVATASMQETNINGQFISPLIEEGRRIGIGDPIPATSAELLMDVTVEQQGGALLSGAQLIHSSNGVTYITLTSVLLDSDMVQVMVKAVSDQVNNGGKGVIGNLQAGNILEFVNPLSSISRQAVVVSQAVTGAEAESEETYRRRILDRWQKRPQGGALADYLSWGLEASGIINIFPYRSNTPGQVEIYAEATPESSGNEDGIPTQAQLEDIERKINFDENGLATRRPVSAIIQVLPISRITFDVRITGISVSDIASTQSNILSALDEYFQNVRPFIEGLDIPPRFDTVATTVVGGIVSDIVANYAGFFTKVFVSLNGENIDLYTLGIGEKAKLGGVVFQ